MGPRAGLFGDWVPWAEARPVGTMVDMSTADRRYQRAADLVAAPGALAALEEALQVLNVAWYQVAADASPGIVERRRGRGSEGSSWPRCDGESREPEASLMATLHDVAAAFARCARASSDGRSTAAPIVERRMAGDDRRRGQVARHPEEATRP
jgi:hypothetical protein